MLVIIKSIKNSSYHPESFNPKFDAKYSEAFIVMYIFFTGFHGF